MRVVPSLHSPRVLSCLVAEGHLRGQREHRGQNQEQQGGHARSGHASKSWGRDPNEQIKGEKRRVIKRHVTTRTLRLLFCVLVFCVLVCLAYWSYLQTIRTGSACQTCLSDFSEKSAA
jgi:hypothetical protein